MTKPLALIFYERLLPGSQLVNRLHDLEYRVETLTEAALLPKAAQEKRPLVMILDLVSKGVNICDLIRELKVQPSTSHSPIIGFADQNQKKLHDQAVNNGADLVAYDDALLPQLPQLLEHALHVE
jgi:CheY-like chemotaxis protein